MGAASALCVPINNDPLVLERTVNHIIYHPNGNGNGHEDGNAFLYSEADLSKLVFPVTEEAAEETTAAVPAPAPETWSGAENEAAGYAESESPASADDSGQPGGSESSGLEPAHAPDPLPSPGPVSAAQPWEVPAAAGMGALLGTTAMMTPMAAGAAHALASLGAHQAQTQETPPGLDSSRPPEPPLQAPPDLPGAESVQEADPTPALATIPPATATDFVPAPPDSTSAAAASAPALEAAATRDFDVAPPGGGTASAGFETAAAAASAKPAATPGLFDGPAPSSGSFEPAATPSVGGSSQSLEPGIARAPAETSAQASRRPGLMDFFSATTSGATPKIVPGEDEPIVRKAESNSRSSQADSSSSLSGAASQVPAFISGTQASILQNAIQAAAALDVQTSTNAGGISQEQKAPARADGSEPKKSLKKGSKSKKSVKTVGVGGEKSSEADGLTRSRTKLEAPAADKPKGDEKTKTSLRKLEGAGKKADRGSKDLSRSQAKDEKIELLGFTVPLKMLKIAGVLLVFVGFPFMVLVANVTSIIAPFLGGGGGGGGGGAAAIVASSSSGMSGQWEFAFQNPDASISNGSMVICQNGGNLQGYGVDRSGSFQMKGTLEGDRITFHKQYTQGGQARGKPILYSGRVEYNTDTLRQGQRWYAHMDGIWQLTKGVGLGWRHQIVQLQGKWEAGLTRRGSDTGTGTVANMPDSNMPIQAPTRQGAADFFMKVALGIIAVGVVLAMVSLRLFGPAGLLNIWAKKEYIPSQFHSPHFKMVGEMGKRLKPGGIPLGRRVEWGLHQFWRPCTLNLPPDIREQNPHTLFLGGGATGKSRLMASWIAHDMVSADRAVVVIDSDGALVDLLMDWIAAHPKGKQLAKRVTVIDPTYEGQTIGYNPLEFPADGDLQNAASSVVFGFKAVYTEPPGSQTQWNQQTANILRNTAVLLMANNKTLTDVPLLLSDNDFRDVMLEKVERLKNDKAEYTTLIDAWTNYKRLARTDQWINWIEPILNRIQPTLGDPRIRPILTRPRSDISLQDIILQKRILLVKIPQGQLDQAGNLLGALIVTGIKQAALSLSVRMPEEEARPVSLYLDELDSFIEKETFDAISSESRKFQIGFYGASKTLQTLPEDYRNQLVINVGLMAIFALAKKDGDMLGPQMFRVDGRKVKHQTIQNVFNKVNTSPQFELISDEEKLNIDRVVGQEERTYFLYRVGTVAGVFHMLAPDFKDIPEKDVNMDIRNSMYENHPANKHDEDDDA
jgi:hypothetical protein